MKAAARPANVGDHIVVEWTPGEERVVCLARWSRRRTDAICRVRVGEEKYGKERRIPADALLRHEDGTAIERTPAPPHRGKK